MSTEELMRAISATCGVKHEVVKDVVKAMLNVLEGALSSGEEVRLTEFGRLYVKTNAPRLARNPRTNEPIQVGERRVVRLKASPTLDRVLNRPRRLP